MVALRFAMKWKWVERVDGSRYALEEKSSGDATGEEHEDEGVE